MRSTQKRFTRHKLSMKRMKSFPLLKGKAHNTLVVLQWLQHLCQVHSDGSADHSLRHTIAFSWHKFFQLCRESPRFLGDDAVAEIIHLSKYMFHGWVGAAELAHIANLAFWKLIPKHHLMCP